MFGVQVRYLSTNTGAAEAGTDGRTTPVDSSAKVVSATVVPTLGLPGPVTRYRPHHAEAVPLPGGNHTTFHPQVLRYSRSLHVSFMKIKSSKETISVFVKNVQLKTILSTQCFKQE